MNNRRISGVVLALAAGLVGGLVSRYVAPTVALAQAQPAPKELRAQNFVLVNDQGNPVGLFGFDPQGKPIIKLIAENGRTIWSSEMPLAPYSGPIPPAPPPPPPLRTPTPQSTPQK
jgi:hypothetical protein